MRKANKKLMVGIGIVGTVALLGLLAMGVNAQGPWGFVFIDENGNGQFDAGEWNSTAHLGVIQDAVDAASPGDTIYVWDGHYYEDVIVNKTVTIIGNTTIDAMSYSYGKNTSLGYDEFGFWVEADNVNISGFHMWCAGGDASGIHLNNTQYCNISGNMISGDPSDGICIENSSHNMIYNNIISQNGEGIWLINGSNNTISNNYIDDNFIGIWMTNGSGYNTINMNNISYNNGYGIVYEPQPYDYSTPCWNTITYNNISYNEMWGIMMGNTSNETIMHNDFYGNGDSQGGGAVYFANVNDSNIAYNNLFNNTDGVWLTGCRDIDVLYNTILFRSMGFGDTGIWDSMGFCHSNLSYNTISGYEFGIYAGYTDNETILGNNISYCVYAGIWLDYVWDSTVGHNTLYFNGMDDGPGAPSNILMTDCYNVSVFYNDINGSYELMNAGITISSMVYGPQCYNTLANNTIWGCYAGIYLEGTDNETIENNVLFENHRGIDLFGSVNNTIDGNTITNNSRGIYLVHSPYNDIINNYIAGNIDMFMGPSGIHIGADSNHTTILYNTITRNDVGIYVLGGNDWDGYENVDTQIHYNHIYGNWMYGLMYDINESAGTPWINATYNWWGAANGPDSSDQYDPITYNYAEGEGDWLYGNHSYDNIHFDPWLGLMLYQGWNLITPAFNHSVQNASDLMDIIPHCTIVTMWDNIHQKYVSYVNGFGEDFEIDNASGYFVFVTENTNVQFFGKLCQPTINMTLYPGYNLIGWPYIMYSPAGNIADNITNCIKIAKWNAQEQTWVAEYITALDSYNFDMLMGEGAFVFVSGQSQWQVEPYWWI